MNTIIVIKVEVIIRLEAESGPPMTRCVTRMISQKHVGQSGPGGFSTNTNFKIN